jgi:hypothetical protein
MKLLLILAVAVMVIAHEYDEFEGGRNMMTYLTDQDHDAEVHY